MKKTVNHSISTSVVSQHGNRALTCSSVYQMHLSIVLSLVCRQPVLTFSLCAAPLCTHPVGFILWRGHGEQPWKAPVLPETVYQHHDTLIKKNDNQYLQLALMILNQMHNRSMTYLYYMELQHCGLSWLHITFWRVMLKASYILLLFILFFLYNVFISLATTCTEVC